MCCKLNQKSTTSYKTFTLGLLAATKVEGDDVYLGMCLFRLVNDTCLAGLTVNVCF